MREQRPLNARQPANGHRRVCVPCMSSAPTTVGQLKCQKYKFSLKFLLCVGIFFFQRVQIPYASRYIGKALVSRKLVVGDDSSEGSETANSGTDEQERYMRHICLG